MKLSLCLVAAFIFAFVSPYRVQAKDPPAGSSDLPASRPPSLPSASPVDGTSAPDLRKKSPDADSEEQDPSTKVTSSRTAKSDETNTRMHHDPSHLDSKSPNDVTRSGSSKYHPAPTVSAPNKADADSHRAPLQSSRSNEKPHRDGPPDPGSPPKSPDQHQNHSGPSLLDPEHEDTADQWQLAQNNRRRHSKDGVIAKTVFVGERCIAAAKDCTQNAWCDPSSTTCVCMPIAVAGPDKKTCVEKTSLGEQCQKDTVGVCGLTLNSVCNDDGVCVCERGYPVDETEKSCVQNAPKSTCTDVDDCPFEGAVCSEDATGTRTCACRPEYTTTATGCSLKVIGSECKSAEPEVSACPAIAYECGPVDNDVDKCKCTEKYIDKKGKCEPRAIGDLCSKDEECATDYATCENPGNRVKRKCGCQTKDWAVDTEDATRCERLPVALGQNCMYDKHCWNVTNAECSTNGTMGACQCKEKYTRNDANTECKELYLGDTCDRVGPCFTENTVCLNSKCTCSPPGYMDDNTITPAKQCITVPPPTPFPYRDSNETERNATGKPGYGNGTETPPGMSDGVLAGIVVGGIIGAAMCILFGLVLSQIIRWCLISRKLPGLVFRLNRLESRLKKEQAVIDKLTAEMADFNASSAFCAEKRVQLEAATKKINDTQEEIERAKKDRNLDKIKGTVFYRTVTKGEKKGRTEILYDTFEAEEPKKEPKKVPEAAAVDDMGTAGEPAV